LIAANSSGGIIKPALKALLNISFDDAEDAVVLGFVQNPPPQLQAANRDIMAEWILTRLIAQGRYIEASKIVDTPPLKPSDNQAARRRALLKKGLFSVMSELDASILEVEQQQDTAPLLTNGIHDEHENQANIAQLPWAPSPSVPELQQAKSLADAQANESRKEEAKHASPVKPYNVPLSASPAFRADSPQINKETGQAGSNSAGMKNVISALRASSHGSPMRKTSFTNLQNAQDSPRIISPMSSTPYSLSGGSPFAAPPRLAQDHLRQNAVSRSPAQPKPTSFFGGPAPVHKPSLPAQIRMQRDAISNSPARSTYQPERSPSVAPQSTKRSAPEPSAKAGRSKMRAIEADMEVDEGEKEKKGTREQETDKEEAQKPAERQLTPSRKRLPGHFGSSQSDHEMEEQTAAPEEEEEEEDQVPEMRQVKNSSPVSRVSTSSRKPRHVRGSAPEPPTPAAQPIRRSKRISAASREQSREPASPPPVAQKASKSKRGGRSRNTRAGSVASDISEA